MMLVLESPTEDSVEVAIAFLKECGSKLQEVGLTNIYVMLLLGSTESIRFCICSAS